MIQFLKSSHSTSVLVQREASRHGDGASVTSTDSLGIHSQPWRPNGNAVDKFVSLYSDDFFSILRQDPHATSPEASSTFAGGTAARIRSAQQSE